MTYAALNEGKIQTLKDAEKRYSQTESEELRIVVSIKRWQYFLYGNALGTNTT